MTLINLFHINQYKIDTSKIGNFLHGEIVEEFEKNFAEYVGAKYACSSNSASSLIFLSLKELKKQNLDQPLNISIPSIIPPVVPNAILMSGNTPSFYDNIDWVGNSYNLFKNESSHIVDSAQEVTKNQYKILGNPNAEIIYSFYPTKPVGGCDGGMVVSDNEDIINSYKIDTLNGMEFSENNWERKQVRAGYKMHFNSLSSYIANENLKKIEEKNERLDEIQETYNSAFGYNNISRHLYRVRVKNNKTIVSQLKGEGISCGIHYEYCHNKPFYKKVRYRFFPSLAKSELESRQTISIPFHERLSNEDVDKVIKNIRGYIL